MVDGFFSASERVQRLAAETGERPDRIAAQLGLVSDAELAASYAQQIGSPILTTADYPGEPVTSDSLRPIFLRHARVLPLALDEAGLTVAMADPLDDAAVRALEFALERPVLRRVGLQADIEAAFRRLYEATTPAVDAGEADDRPDEDRDADLERLRDGRPSLTSPNRADVPWRSNPSRAGSHEQSPQLPLIRVDMRYGSVTWTFHGRLLRSGHLPARLCPASAGPQALQQPVTGPDWIRRGWL